MILVVGAMTSGKRTYVTQLLGFTQEEIADGILDEKPVLYNLQNLVAQNPEKSMGLLEELLQKEVVICNEVGSGIIPTERNERLAREATGRLCNALAQKSDKVIRIVCGIPTVIKG